MEILAHIGKMRCGFCHTNSCGSYHTKFAFRLAVPITPFTGARAESAPSQSSEGLSSPYSRRKDPLTAHRQSKCRDCDVKANSRLRNATAHVVSTAAAQTLCAVLISHLLNPESCRNDRCGRVRAARWHTSLSSKRSDIGRTSAHVWNGVRSARVRRKSQDRCAKNG